MDDPLYTLCVYAMGPRKFTSPGTCVLGLLLHACDGGGDDTSDTDTNTTGEEPVVPCDPTPRRVCTAAGSGVQPDRRVPPRGPA